MSFTVFTRDGGVLTLKNPNKVDLRPSLAMILLLFYNYESIWREGKVSSVRGHAAFVRPVTI